MIPFYLILTSMGLLTAGNDPKYPHTATVRGLNTQSVHSVHNYKQPHSVASTQGKSQFEVVVNQITPQSIHYKQQRTVRPSATSLMANYNPTSNPSERNYKSQLSVQSMNPVDQSQQSTTGN